MTEVKNIPVILNRDYWSGKNRVDKATGLLEEERVKAGETIMVSREEAMRMIERGSATRADPLPS